MELVPAESATKVSMKAATKVQRLGADVRMGWDWLGQSYPEISILWTA
jgi:hypothetical protein